MATSVDDDAFGRLVEERRPAVTTWRYASVFAAPHRPEPWWAEREGRECGWLEPGGTDDDRLRVGFDDAGLVVLVEERSFGDRAWSGREVWVPEGDGCWIIEAGFGVPIPAVFRVTLLVDPPGRVETLVWAERAGLDVGIEHWTWADGRPVRGVRAEAGEERWASASAFVAELDEEGRLNRLRRGVDAREFTEANRLAAGEVDGALMSALDDAAAVSCDSVIWRADLHRPEPVLRASADLEEILTDGLTRAVQSAVAAAGVDRPFAVEVRPAGDSDPGRARLPGIVRVASERFRDALRRFSSADGEALRRLWKAVEDGSGAEVKLADHCDAETLAACREINTATAIGRGFDDPDGQRADDVMDAVARRLAVTLNRPGAFRGTADPFLAVVEHGARFADEHGLKLARAAIGEEAVERFVKEMASTVDQRADAERVAGARQDRAELARWLTDRGLGAHAERLAHTVAVDAFRLAVADGEAGAHSRIGGDGLLPPGVPWPRTAAGRPLSFLAGIDLAEFPITDRHAAGPRAGWLLFWADMDDQGEALGFIGEPTPNEEGADARVLWLPAGVAPEPAVPPDDLADEPHVRLPLQHVAGTPQLTLPDGWDVGQELGLGVSEAEAYDEIAALLRYGPPSSDAPDAWFDEDVAIGGGDDARRPHVEGASFATFTFEIVECDPEDFDDAADNDSDVDMDDHAEGFRGLDEPDDWLLGAVSGVQGTGIAPGMVLLLHLGSIEFQDGGAIQFVIPRDALAAADFTQVVTEGDSC